jgi:predicted phage tail protein
LQQQENDGDIVGTSVKYHIDLAGDGGAYSTVLTKTVTEKLSSLYELTHRINLTKGQHRLAEYVSCVTPTTAPARCCRTKRRCRHWVIDARLRYPHTALLYISFNAKSFNNIPKISVSRRAHYPHPFELRSNSANL